MHLIRRCALLFVPLAVALASFAVRAQSDVQADLVAPTAEAAVSLEEQAQPRVLNAGAAVGAALGGVLGLAAGVAVDAAAFVAILGSDQALQALLAAGGGVAPLLFLVAAVTTGGGASLGAWVGGADTLGVPMAAGGAVVALPVGMVAGSLVGGLVGFSIAAASGASDSYGGFALGAFSGVGIGALVSAAGGAAAGALIEERDVDLVFGRRAAAGVE